MRNSNSTVQRFFVILFFLSPNVRSLSWWRTRGEVRSRKCALRSLTCSRRTTGFGPACQSKTSQALSKSQTKMVCSKLGCIPYDALKCHLLGIECTSQINMEGGIFRQYRIKVFWGRKACNKSQHIFDWRSPSYIHVQFTVYITLLQLLNERFTTHLKYI